MRSLGIRSSQSHGASRGVSGSSSYLRNFKSHRHWEGECRKGFSYRILGGNIIKKIELSYSTGRIQRMGYHRRSPSRG